MCHYGFTGKTIEGGAVPGNVAIMAMKLTTGTQKLKVFPHSVSTRTLAMYTTWRTPSFITPYCQSTRASTVWDACD